MSRPFHLDDGQPFCSYCGRPPKESWREKPQRVCAHCHFGVMLVSPAEALPRAADLFVIVDAELRVKAVSRQAETVLLVQERNTVELPLEQLLRTRAGKEESRRLAELVELAIAGNASTDTIELRTAGDPKIRFSTSVSTCGPPLAALLLLSPLVQRLPRPKPRHRPARAPRRPAATNAGLELLLANFARSVGAEIALLARPGCNAKPVQLDAWGLARNGASIETRKGFVGRTLRSPRLALEPLDRRSDASLAEVVNPPLAYALGARVPLGSAPPGALIAGFSASPPDDGPLLRTAESYATLVGLAIRDPAVLEPLIAAPRHDPLTGCVAHDGARLELAREINRSTRGAQPLSVCLIDLEGFSALNQRHGRCTGDGVLAEVGGVLRDGVRSFDTVGRYGGDVFIAILPQADEPDAHQIARRLSSLILDARMEARDFPVAASIGVAEWRQADSVDELLDRANSALLAAKAQRTGVMTASRLLAG